MGSVIGVSALEAFRREASALSGAVAGLSEQEWALPTRCVPWSVRELLGHVRVAVAWLPDMLAAGEPDRAEVSAAGYYRPDDRFAPRTNAARIELARDYAAGRADVAGDFTATWQRADRLCRAERADRVVRTRHGDAMRLSEFLITRVVEVAVHGLDLSDALDRRPWLTPEAAGLVLELLLGPDWPAAMRTLGWDEPGLLRRATGRRPLDPAETARVDELGIRWLTLG
jgi:uncharacterized protein (TIGR03083 family)